MNESEDKKLFVIPLDDLKFRYSEENLTNHIITLYKRNGQNIYQNYKELELECKTADQLKSWTKSFAEALNGHKSVSVADSIDKI